MTTIFPQLHTHLAPHLSLQLPLIKSFLPCLLLNHLGLLCFDMSCERYACNWMEFVLDRRTVISVHKGKVNTHV